MKYNFSFLILLFVSLSCGPRPSVSIAKQVQDTESYVTSINNNINLDHKTIEGALTDAEGFKDIGSFTYTVFFDGETKKLMKIKNIETTDRTLSETYFYKNEKLVFIQVNEDGKKQDLFIRGNKVISETTLNMDMQKLLLNKAKRFEKNFKMNR